MNWSHSISLYSAAKLLVRRFVWKYIQTELSLFSAHPVVDDKGDIASFLTGHKPIQKKGQSADEALCNGSGASLGDDRVTGCHPLSHVVHKAVDQNLHALRILSALVKLEIMNDR